MIAEKSVVFPTDSSPMKSMRCRRVGSFSIHTAPHSSSNL
ncbi:hypothetical protein CHCC15087_1587 [Bacillus licheniformis]|nr:hypothetical protein CHCC15292_2357 [Bacillus licheniformis]TWM18188.1 hypothetical protein CHCC15087_1587 [Bacillus licheniformis]TWM99333.1 hypothetical protein CHCC14596_3669 [Bacillus licheniformis]TWN53833.1 hypothetical protein CHCC14437_0258 [Bacillus licheniformis]